MLVRMTIDANLLKECSDAHGVSGHEGEVRNVFRQVLGHTGEVATAGAGNIVCERAGAWPRVMLAAHMDEIGFLVQSVGEDGFLAVVPIGGWWNHTLLSQKVVVKTRSGRKVRGVIGSKPPHFLPESQRNSVLPIEALFVDVGAASAAEVAELGIALGDPVAPGVEMEALDMPHRWVGKAFDNRAGFYAMLEVMRGLEGCELPNTLIAAGTVQEEVGTRGARTVGELAGMDCASVLEGPPADDTPGFSGAGRQGALGKGAQVRMYDPPAIMNPALVELVRRTAEENGIPFQMTVRRSGGTDAGALQFVGPGVPCVVIGVPTRYIHAHHGVLDDRDLRAVIELTMALVKKLDAAAVASLTDYESLDA